MNSSDPRFYFLRNAVASSDFGLAEQFIAADSSILEARSGIGETVVHYLVVENAHEAVEFLLRAA